MIVFDEKQLDLDSKIIKRIEETEYYITQKDANGTERLEKLIIGLPPTYGNIVTRATLLALADIAKVKKTKESPVAITIRDNKGEGGLLFALIVRYHEADGGETGHWSVAAGVNEADIKDCTVINIDKTTDSEIFEIFNNACKEVAFRFDSADYPIIAAQAAFITIHDELDKNASATDEVEIVIDDFIKASVVVSKGEKIKSISLEGPILKRIIKGDAALEVK